MGAYRAISFSPEKIGLSEKQITNFYSQPGFKFLQNIIEIPTVYTWIIKKFPKLNKSVKKNCDEQLKNQNVEIFTPGIEKIVKKKGDIPKFFQYGIGILHYWRHKKFQKDLDVDVEQTLKETIELVRESISTIPDIEKLDEEEAIKFARKRFEINNKIYQNFKQLIEKDLQTEKKRQMLDDFNKKQEQLQQKKEEMNQAQQGGNETKQEKLEEDIKKLEEDLNNFNKISNNAKEELEKERDNSMGETTEGSNKRNKSLSKDKKAKTPSKKEAEKEKKIQENIEEKKTKEDDSLSIEKLSEETREEIEALFNNLSKSQQAEFKERAEEQLQDFGKAINEEINKKYDENKQEATDKNLKQENIQGIKADKNNKNIIKEQLTKEEKNNMFLCEKFWSEQSGLITHLYLRLLKILRPEGYYRKESGFPQGQELDINRVMQFEQDPTNLNIWFRETQPTIKKNLFYHLVDLSSSMRGKRIQETLNGVAVAVGALDLVESSNLDESNIRQGVLGFHSRVFPIKKIKERLTQEIKEKIFAMPSHTRDKGATTNTYESILYALEEIKQNLAETGNFLLVYSDGEPNSNIQKKLKDLLKKGKKERNKLNIKTILIVLGKKEFGENEIKKLIEEYGYDFGMSMSAIMPKTGKNFSEIISELIEDIVEHPETIFNIN